MFITVKLKWWRVLSFVLLLLILFLGFRYLSADKAESGTGTADTEQEGQVWLV